MHGAQVVAAAAAGKHVFCEKPFTLTKREAEDAVAAVKKAGVTLGARLQPALHPEMIKLRDMIRSGELGTILHVEATMTFPNVLFINPGHWRADPHETPLGGLMPMGVHAVDGMIDLCGPIDHVFAQSFRRAAPIDADDTTSILFRMKEGMSGYLGTMTTTGPGFSFQVFGSKGWLRLEGVTHVAGASSEERRTSLFGTCKFQPIKGEAKIWQAATLDVSRAALEAFAKAAAGRTGLSDPLRPDDPWRRRDRSDRPRRESERSRRFISNHVPDAVQPKRCPLIRGLNKLGASMRRARDDPGSAAHHCARRAPRMHALRKTGKHNMDLGNGLGHLTYSTLVHPADNWEQFYQFAHHLSAEGESADRRQ